MKTSKFLLAGGLLAGAALFLSGCTSAADTADENIKKSAENFEVQRTIAVQSGLNQDKIVTLIEGRCSFEYPDNRRIDVTCKVSDDEYTKNVLIIGDQDRVIIAQEKPIDVSVYHTRIILRPETALPEFDISIGEQ